MYCVVQSNEVQYSIVYYYNSVETSLVYSIVYDGNHRGAAEAAETQLESLGSALEGDTFDIMMHLGEGVCVGDSPDFRIGALPDSQGETIPAVLPASAGQPEGAPDDEGVICESS